MYFPSPLPTTRLSLSTSFLPTGPLPLAKTAVYKTPGRPAKGKFRGELGGVQEEEGEEVLEIVRGPDLGDGETGQGTGRTLWAALGREEVGIQGTQPSMRFGHVPGLLTVGSPVPQDASAVATAATPIASVHSTGDTSLLDSGAGGNSISDYGSTFNLGSFLNSTGLAADGISPYSATSSSTDDDADDSTPDDETSSTSADPSSLQSTPFGNLTDAAGFATDAGGDGGGEDSTDEGGDDSAAASVDGTDGAHNGTAEALPSASDAAAEATPTTSA
ncbi:hypothetical protein JCM8097_004437 [Rhodosporidiobolus ruineniae]